MVTLITGASGQLGQCLNAVIDKYPAIMPVFLSSEQANITDTASLEHAFSTHRPAYCINAAAYTAVDRAQSEPEKAFTINCHGAANLASISRKYNTVLIHISTDFVYDGNSSTPYSEDDTPNPQNVYGLTKLEGEHRIASTWQKHIIIRTSWLYSEFGSNFMKTMLRLGTERGSVNVVADQTGTPTYGIDLANAILTIINSKTQRFGIYHFSNMGNCTWCEFAQQIFNLAEIPAIALPITSKGYPTPALRPVYSVLDKLKIINTFGIVIREWKVALAEAIAAYKSPDL